MRARALAVAATTFLILGPAMASEPEIGRGRFSLFSSWRQVDAGRDRDVIELIPRVAISSLPDEGLEWVIDYRGAFYPSEEGRTTRSSLYQAFVGARLFDGAFRLRVGQMWIHELGGVGSFSGLLAEYSTPETAIGAIRLGVFGGVELETHDVALADDVSKGGVYVAIEGDSGRQHVLGFVRVTNGDLTERSVVVARNFIPVGRSISIYQAAEYDVSELAEVGEDGLSYALFNLRLSPVKALDILVNYHRGRSLDARMLAEIQLDGRPLDPETLEGLLYESLGGRVTVRPVPWLRFWAGYSRDTRNNGDEESSRTQLGFMATNLLNAGFDFSATAWSVDRDNGSYDSWHASLGRSFGRRTYVSLDYDSSVSYFRFHSSVGGIVETRPETTRLALSANLYLSRAFSLLLSGEHMDRDATSEQRVLVGLTYRFRF